MKTKVLVLASGLIVLGVLLFHSCMDCISGDGNMTSKNIKIGEVSKIRLSGDANVILVNDSSEFILIQGESNIIDAYVFDESGDKLKISTEKCLRNHETVTITIPIRVLESFTLNGSGNVSSRGPVRAMDLELALNGSGNIELDLAADEVSADINGSGNINLKGSAKNLDARINGSGNIVAADLAAANVKVTINGSGDCKVMASSALRVVIRGSGNVYYKGTPDISTEVKGSGSVEKMN